MSELDLKNISIIDALPLYECPKHIFTVGAGNALLEYYLAQKLNYNIIASDIIESAEWKPIHNLSFIQYDILKYEEISAPIVICSQVLEHIPDFKTAYKNLIKHAQIRLIITFPYKTSFYSPDHVNFWDDTNMKMFEILANPYRTSISKIRTKPEDQYGDKYDYLLIIDKRQKYA